MTIREMKTATKPFNDFTSFLSLHFPYKVQKISIDAGFSCPNRDGTKGRGGCTYCNNKSFSPEYDNCTKSVSEQLEKGISFFSHKYASMKYIAYFQSYTNTYNDIESLIALYEEALSYPNVVGLVISTRPDCMPDDLLMYLYKISSSYFIIVEYGIESTLNKSLERVNRQHTFEESCETIKKTAELGITVGGHMILGLPGESYAEIINHASALSELPLTTIKLHQLQIIKGTAMAKEYKLLPDSFHIFELDEYVDLCVDFSEQLNPDFYIERFASQSPIDLLLAPNWGIKNHELTEKIIKRFKERNTYQGKLFNKKEQV